MGGNLYLGLDLGIGSCGWALCSDTEIIGMGTRTFDVPETDKERTPTNQLRRQARGMRRVIDRRRQRMNAIRALLHRHGLLDDAGKDALASCADAPWRARAEGLERQLSPRELALALGHMAKHRGFKSNSKRDRGNDPEAGKMLSAVAQTQEKMAGRTVGQMFWQDFPERKRNRDGDYSRTVLRDDLAAEVRLLLRTQRRLGNALASEALEEDFIAAAFTQRPLQDSWNMLGDCPFVPGQKRAAKHAPSFERFRLLSRLNTLRIDGLPLTAEQIHAAMADFGHQQGLSFKALRRKLGLAAGQRFDTVAEAEESRDVVARSGAAMAGSNALYKVLGVAGWQSLSKTPALLDDIAAVLTFCESDDSIRRHLEDLALEEMIVAALMDGLAKGTFSKFKGAGHISAQAARALNEHLAQAMTYDDACKKLGWNHAQRIEGDIDDIRNPIAKKALLEGWKQIKAVVEAHRRPYGLPTHIHVEMARDMGKSLEERQEIDRGINKRTTQRNKLRAEFEELFQRSPRGDDMLRFELWKEQRCESVYSGEAIKHHMLVSDANLVEIDHILPWSRSGDDSPVNKTLCLTSENHNKKGRTPFQWMQEGGPDWDEFVARVETNPNFKGRKKRNYLLHDLDSRKDFVARNLNDTRYACRLLLNKLKAEFKGIDPKDIRARPGALTDRLRRAWDLQNLKKHDDGQRKADDRHHAVDALIVALTSEYRLQQLTTLFQQAEKLGLSTNWRRAHHLAEMFRQCERVPDELEALEPPWRGFRAEVEAAFDRITVSRAERRRARGEAHAATIRQVAERDGEAVVYERKSVEALALKDLERIKDPDRNQAVVQSLRQWIEAGKPKDSPPLSPKGDPIRKVRLATTKKVDVRIRDGAADRGEMARVDVFRKANKKGKWEYYLVPVYPHEVATLATPPNRAMVAHKPEEEWKVMDASYDFLWSLYPLSWIAATKSDGTIVEGYFRGSDRGSAGIDISPPHTKTEKTRGIGVKSLVDFKKFSIDRLGNRTEIQQEKRTWRGEVCI
ncbi:MAG: type II CRISPR RNA-guided endonuclease Cas9 [Magnetospirillum gryphiswaldense]|nr:type II CRISPR RNA-guided endonuclease Cas9 [Magnetospirillum gryphiswaldense]